MGRNNGLCKKGKMIREIRSRFDMQTFENFIFRFFYVISILRWTIASNGARIPVQNIDIVSILSHREITVMKNDFFC